MSAPPPVKNGETPTTDTLLARPWVRASWGYLFRRRQELGVARYGTPLQPFNGRDAILDASEEFQDATVYAEQCIREGRVPLLVGAALQLLCLFALRVLWYYAGVATRERIVGLERTDATEEVKADVFRRWYDKTERIEAVLEPRHFTAEELEAAMQQSRESMPFLVESTPHGEGGDVYFAAWQRARAQTPLQTGTYDPPDSQEPLGFMEDMPTMNLRAVVPPVPDTGLDDEESLEGHNLKGGHWIQNGPVYNGVPSWQWVGGWNNRGNSVSKRMDRIWEDRLRSENASEA